MLTDPKLATAMAFHGEAMRVPQSAVIFEGGESADGIYIVRSGSVTIQLLNKEDRLVWSRTVSEAGILGLPAAINHHPHRVRAVASENAEMIFVRANTLNELIQKDPSLGALVVLFISKELYALCCEAVGWPP